MACLLPFLPLWTASLRWADRGKRRSQTRISNGSVALRCEAKASSRVPTMCSLSNGLHDRDGARINAPLSRSVGSDRRQDDDRDVGGPFIGAKRFKGPIALH